MTGTEAGMDYKSTVLTPKTDFPQRGNLPVREPEMLARWEESKLNDKIEASRKDAKPFILHDGPPYANGHIHTGHALNKVLKDLIVRYKTMAGFYSAYIPGWDCHGLPIEQKVIEQLQKSKAGHKSPIEIRRLCAEYALKWVDTQREEFQRLGIGGEWDKPYLTLTPEYEEAIVRALSTLVEKGLVFKGFKPVHWDPVFETALAEAEIEYNDNHVSNSIYVRFPLVEQELPKELKDFVRPTIVIWTTTPWTLPANLGVTVHPNFDYVGYKVGDETLLIAEGLLLAFKTETGMEGEVVGRFKGDVLDRLLCAHPIFPGKTSLVMNGEHVTLEQGTGCVHTAPAHGVEDFLIGRKYDLGVFNPVDDAGKYNELYPEMQGVSVFAANEKVIEKFRNEGTLIWAGKVTHSYPYSWRSHKPVIMRATEQWFMDLEKDDLRQKALAEIDKVQWIPKWGRERIFNMVEGRPDWCLSRQRSWGVPIPSVRDKKTGESVLNKAIVDRFADYVAKEGTDCWFTRPVEDFLPADMAGEADRYEKEFNILDVWFDSGASHLGVLDPRENLSWPADLYLEGSDQHRGWFQSSLWVAMGVKGSAPYKAVLTHGFVLDGKGQPMSKSLGNVISPLNVIKNMGADVLRLWVASEEYRTDVSVSPDIIKQVSGVYRRMRNTLRFLLGNISDFNPDTNAVPFEQMAEDDRWVMARLVDLEGRVRKAYDEYEFHRVYHALNAFCVTDLGAVFLDCAKDRLYCSAPDDAVRRSCQTATFHVATSLLRMLAPILPFTADEAWGHLPGWEGKEESVHLANFPENPVAWRDEALLAKWERLLELRSEVQKAIEPLRQAENKVIGNSLEAAIVLRTAEAETLEFLRQEEDLLRRLFITSQVRIVEETPAEANEVLENVGLTLSLEVVRAEGEKCERCWVYSTERGGDPAHPALCPRCTEVVRRLTS
ncbi:MAG: isoleucyl-tRNA synthetase [Candidatus Sumerlaeota bacterium]|nr:isoleucyl-tRNA synthetase [Candidatus Sumerlaeota bacterium]